MRDSKLSKSLVIASTAFTVEEDTAEEVSTKDDKLDLFALLAAIDRRDLNYYDGLSEQHKKQFSAYMSLMWSAYVDGDASLQHYYIAAMNHYANQHLFDINKHPKLQYLCLIAGSPGAGRQRHTWIKARKSESNPITKELMKLFPHKKQQDLELLATMLTARDIKAYQQELGDA